MKYDKMVEINKRNSKLKVEASKRIIQKMFEGRERITVTALAEYTGFDRSFFYRNLEVRKAVEEAASMQLSGYDPDLTQQNVILKQKVFELKVENMKLKSRIERLTAENHDLIFEKNNSLQNIKKGNESV